MATILKCPSCGRGYPSRWRLRRHLESHVPDRHAAFALASTVTREPCPTTWRCVACSRSFGTLKGLSVHSRSSAHLQAEEDAARPPLENYIV